MSSEYPEFRPQAHEEPNGGAQLTPQFDEPRRITWGDYEVAGLPKRIASWAIDMGFAVVILLLFQSQVHNQATMGLVLCGVWALNTVVLQGLTGRSIGRLLTRTVLVRAMRDERDRFDKVPVRVNLPLLVLRQICSFFIDSVFCIGLIAALASRQRRSVGDVVCGTIVLEIDSMASMTTLRRGLVRD